jgi:DNA (cytosine-5)-methyltransferase 1/putative restriction endonuclease
MASLWTREQLFLALRLYFETPFGRLHKGNPDIIALAERVGRTASAVAMKLSNFASLDPQIVASGRKGLDGASAQDRAVWAEFTADWEGALAATEASSLAGQRETETMALQNRRIGQEFFRKAVLANFNNHCCATGINEPCLLVASHIMPWAHDRQNRLNPANGLCLSGTHDRAFDAGLITLDENWRWLVSCALLDNGNEATRATFRPLAGQPLRPPSTISISPVFVSNHRKQAFSRHRYV